MDKCKKCFNKFQYTEILNSIWLKGWYEPVICDKCDTRHFANISTRVITNLSIFGPLIVYNLANLIFDDYINFNIIVPYIIWVVIVIFSTPYYARFHIKLTDEQNDTQALLVSNLNSMEAEIITSLLDSYEVPYLKEVKGMSGVMEIYAGSSNYGIDIYVQPQMLQIAKDLINPDNIEDEY